MSLSSGLEGEAVQLFALDSLDFAQMRLLKIDVEGMEIEVIEGARHDIARHRPIIYVENDRREKSPLLIGLLQELGYDLWWHVPRLFNPKNFFGESENIFSNVGSINVMGIPKEDHAKLLDLYPSKALTAGGRI